MVRRLSPNVAGDAPCRVCATFSFISFLTLLEDPTIAHSCKFLETSILSLSRRLIYLIEMQWQPTSYINTRVGSIITRGNRHVVFEIYCLTIRA
jgi:hypothetical protein